MASACGMGIDLGGQSVKLAIVDAAGAVVLRRQAAVDAAWPAERMAQRIAEEVAALQVEGRSAGWSPLAAGMVMPGYMDTDRSELTFAANLPLLGGNGFLKHVRRACPLPTVFDADSNAAAYAEYRFGAGRGADRLIVAVVGTGIGAGVVIGGELVRLWHHIAGSLGHVSVDARGPRCKCGARGCVEAHAAGPALERAAQQAADANPGSVLAELRQQHGRLTGVEIRSALDRADPAAMAVVRTAGWWLGAGIAAWSVIYHPDRVLLGGGISQLGEPWLEAVRAGVAEVGQPAAVRKLAIAAAALGPDAGVIGAAALAMTAAVS